MRTVVMLLFVGLVVTICGIPVSSANNSACSHEYITDKARCEYYTRVQDILRDDVEEEQDHDMRDGVERLLNDYIDKAAQPPMFDVCIPFVSQYTDCSRENICTGCSRCNCDLRGKRSCSRISSCRPEIKVAVDHRVLVIVMENLLDDNSDDNDFNERRKRSLAINSVDKNDTEHEKILKWMYGVNYIDKTNNTAPQKHYIDSTMKVIPDFSDYITETLHNYNPGLSFNEKLRNNIVQLESKELSYSPKEFIHLLDKIINTRIMEPSNDLETISVENGNYNDLLITRPRQKIVKRDIIKDKKINLQNFTQNNFTGLVKDVTQDCIVPLNIIINTKFKEFSELITVRDKLLYSLKSYTGVNISNPTQADYDNNTNAYFFIDQPDISDLNADSRRSTEIINEKLKTKLILDIQEVMRDVAILQRNSKKSLSNELKHLIQAFRHFVHSYKNTPTKSKDKKLIKKISTRRHNMFDNIKVESNSVLLINKIIEFMDKNMPINDVLKSLSTNVRKIMRRVINQYYTDVLATANSKIKNTEYNIANDFTTISNRLKNFISDISNVTPPINLYKYKLLHLKVSADISELNDIMTVLSFNQRRRMTMFDNESTEIALEKLNSDFEYINFKVTQQIEEQITRDKYKSTLITKKLNDSHKEKQKMSFFQRVKKIFKKSKQDISELLKNKKSKINDIDRIAKNRLDEIRKKKLRDYEETLRRWQNNLNIAPRKKRSVNNMYNKFMNRIKSIIPTYLHRKVKPAVDSKKKIQKHDKKIKATTKRTIITTSAKL